MSDSDNRKPKTKRQCAAKAKQEELDSIVHKGLSDIYKRLARVLHPDLEQDKELRIAKEAIMIRLTDAYRRKDLYTLLQIETEAKFYATNEHREKRNTKDIEPCAAYNIILKNQIKTLEDELTLCIPLRHQKYAPIQQFYNGRSSTIITNLKQQCKLIMEDIHNFHDLVLRLKTPAGKEIIKAAIKENLEEKKLQKAFLELIR